jgi:hypothetical protein
MSLNMLWNKYATAYENLFFSYFNATRGKKRTSKWHEKNFTQLIRRSIYSASYKVRELLARNFQIFSNWTFKPFPKQDLLETFFWIMTLLLLCKSGIWWNRFSSLQGSTEAPKGEGGEALRPSRYAPDS